MTHQSSLKFHTKPKRKHPEQKIQQAIVSAVMAIKMPNIIFFSCVNEGRRGYIDGSNLKKAGMRAGVGDLCFIIGGWAHFMEVKAAGNKQTPEQMLFQSDCKAAGVPYEVVYSLVEALPILEAWGAIHKTARRTYASAA